MAVSHGYKTKFLLRDVDISTFVNESTFTTEVETSETTTYGKKSRTRVAGLEDHALSFGGFFDPVSDGIDAELKAIKAGESAVPATIGYGGLAVGQGVSMINGILSSYEVADPVAEVVTFTADMEGHDGGGTGVSLHDLTAETATGNGTGVDAGARTVTTSAGGVGHLHVTAVAGTTPSITVKIQDSADGTTFADILTFTAATARTSERKTMTGTVRRHIRVIWTITGTSPSFTFTVAFVRGSQT